jgi:hypothetical protein
MACKHPKRHRWAVNYVWQGVIVCRIDCMLCGGVVPLGPSSDTPQAELEALAARIASDPDDDCLGMSDMASFWAGWAGCEQLDPPYKWEPRLYAAGALAREIHGEEGA